MPKASAFGRRGYIPLPHPQPPMASQADQRGFAAAFLSNPRWKSWLRHCEALVLAPCRCLLSCACSLLVTFTLFQLSSPCSRSYYNFPTLCLQVPTTVFSVLPSFWFSVTFKPRRYACCSLPERFSFYRSRGVMLSMRNKTVQLDHVFLSPRMPIMFSGQTDKWPGHTDTRSDELPLNKQMWGSLTLAFNYCTSATLLAGTL